MKKKKVMHLITGLGTGGAETILSETIPRLQTDFSNSVCCIIGRGPVGKIIEKSGVPVFYLELKNPFDIGAVIGFGKLLRSEKPDILVTYLIHADLFGRIIGRIFGIRQIVSSKHGSLLQWDFLKLFDGLTSFLVKKYVVLTVTEQDKIIRELKIPKERTAIIPNGIDLKKIDTVIDMNEKKRRLGVDNGNLNIVCVGNLREGKGHEYLLKAFEDAYGKTKRVNLLIVGDGEKKETLLSQIAGYESKKSIYFLGNRTDVIEILKISDIFVMPTLAEGMSMAILEAMAVGLPIITTNIPANKELIVDEIDGLLVTPRDSKEISRAIRKLVREKKLRDRLGLSAKTKAAVEFDIEVTAKMLSDILNELSDQN